MNFFVMFYKFIESKIFIKSVVNLIFATFFENDSLSFSLKTF
jgi:hypothetical protein